MSKFEIRKKGEERITGNSIYEVHEVNEANEVNISLFDIMRVIIGIAVVIIIIIIIAGPFAIWHQFSDSFKETPIQTIIFLSTVLASIILCYTYSRLVTKQLNIFIVIFGSAIISAAVITIIAGIPSLSSLEFGQFSLGTFIASFFLALLTTFIPSIIISAILENIIILFTKIRRK